MRFWRLRAIGVGFTRAGSIKISFSLNIGSENGKVIFTEIISNLKPNPGEQWKLCKLYRRLWGKKMAIVIIFLKFLQIFELVYNKLANLLRVLKIIKSST